MTKIARPSNRAPRHTKNWLASVGSISRSSKRSKVTRWYKVVHKIELRVPVMQLSEVDAVIAELEGLDDILARELTVSSAYMANVYELRTHIQYVVAQLQKRRARLTAGPPSAVAGPGLALPGEN
jgi:hypothetical protein